MRATRFVGWKPQGMTRESNSPSPGNWPAIGGRPLAGQAELDALRRDQSGTCWWCGKVADSREHRHKASLLRRMWGEEGVVLGQEGKELFEVPGPNSRSVKFAKTLCRNCNNTRSQPFDYAYDHYADFIHSNGDLLARTRSIDWRDVYGEEWKDSTRMLGCYAVKSFGCWIAESGFPPPRVFARFLDGGDLTDTRLMMARQQSASLVYRAMALDGEERFDRGTGVLPSVAWISPDEKRLTAYEHYSYISDICMRVNWSDSSGDGELFWLEPITPLEIIPASVGQRVLALEVGARALVRRLRRRAGANA